MHKKLIMACMAVVALAAFALPALASASPVLTDSAGKAVAVGTEITGKNVGNTLFTGAFNVTCSTADLSGKVTENSGTSIKGEVPAGSASFTGTGTGGDCTSALGNTKVTVNSALCLATTKIADQFEVTGCGANVTFTLEITGTGPCKYKAAKVLATFTTAPADAQVTVTEQPAELEEGGFFCPSSGKLDMVFALTTKAGGTLTIS
jgi:hypothetical protein